MEWQPINTAPAQKPVLVFCPDNHPAEVIMMGELHRLGGWRIHIDGQPIDPTHWMPLPPPPE